MNSDILVLLKQVADSLDAINYNLGTIQQRLELLLDVQKKILDELEHQNIN